MVLGTQIIKKELSVRQVERIARSYKNPNRKSSNVSPDIYLNDLSKILENKLGLKVRINGNSNSGKVEIRYKALDELNKIMNSIK